MKQQIFDYYFAKLCRKKEHFPFVGQLELTYRCNLNCVHCYCKGIEAANQKGQEGELTTAEIRKILDEIQREGCISVTFTGGDPLLRDDFLEIYSYAKQKGFIISIFTNAQEFRSEIIDFLVKSPPYLIEITLNGITEYTYEAITRVQGSFAKVMQTIKLLAKNKLRLFLKTNCLKQNKHELAKIKAFSEEALGRPRNGKFFYKYDPLLFPKLNGDIAVCENRLSFQELWEARRQDKDIWDEFQENLHSDMPECEIDNSFLYHCNNWKNNFYINPYGRLKFCPLSDKFSTDLKTASFREGFYHTFPKLTEEKFKTRSKCRDCSLRSICNWCPARAYLETSDEEAMVPYYCQMAEATFNQSKIVRSKGKRRRKYQTFDYSYRLV